LSYEEQKEQERRQRKAKKAVEDSEALIVEYEAAIAEMDNQLANHPESATTEFFEKYEAAKKQLADELNNWERLTMELEGL
jgi:ATP-binding cassette subfamily F protein 3